MITLCPRYYGKICLLTLFCFLGITQTACADESEYQVKAAMIYNFTRFMDWPEDAQQVAPSQRNICVVGKGPLGAAVDSLRGKQVKGRTVTVQMITHANNLAGCQVLVLSGLDKSATTDLLERSLASAVLTVSDSAGFAASGGVVGFVLQGGKVRFEINPAAAQRHRIRISAQLLKLANIVQDKP